MKGNRYTPYIPIEILETLLDDSFPERKERGTDKDWLVKLSHILGELHGKGKYRNQKDGRVFYTIPRKNYLDRYFTRIQEVVNGKKRTKKYKLGLVEGDSVDKIVSLVFRRGRRGNGYTKRNSEYYIRNSLQELFDYAYVSNIKQPKRPDYTLPINVRIQTGDIPSEVKVNIANIMGYVDGIDIYLKRYDQNKNTITPEDFLHKHLNASIKYNNEDDVIEKIKYYRNRLFYIQLLHNSPKGYMFYQTYTQNDSGRLTYDKRGDINFQTLERPIRNIVFGGMGHYDIDVISCWPNILNQYYTIVSGKENDWLSYYAENTNEVRYKIKEELDIHYGLGKELLLSMITSGGGNIPTSKDQADFFVMNLDVYKTFENIKGYYPNEKDAKDVLYRIAESNTIRTIKNELGGLLEELEERNGLGVIKDGYIKNVVGVKNYNIKKPSQRLTNVLMSIESKILYEAIRHMRHKMVALYHDGFIVNKEISKESINDLEEKVRYATKEGIDMFFQRHKIQPVGTNNGIQVRYNTQHLSGDGLFSYIHSHKRNLV